MTSEENSEVRDTLLLSSGLALIIFGAGLIMAHPVIRKAVQAGLGALVPELGEPLKSTVGNVLPDVERYLKLRAM
jgi:hypothetical protein